MNCDVTINKDDWKTLHNALCGLRSVYQDMHQSMIKTERIESVISEFERALADAYEQDNRAFENLSGHYDEVRQSQGLRSIWSIYEVECLDRHHPFQGALQVAYRDHWGDKPVFAEIKGDTWIDLYRAADECIRASGDDHHVFIEQFRVNKECPEQLLLSTGS